MAIPDAEISAVQLCSYTVCVRSTIGFASNR